MNEPLKPTPASTLYRATDGETSREAARSVSMRSGSQKALLLKAYADGSILTDDEAAERAGLLAKIGCCWWHRCSDLRKEGLIKQVTLQLSQLTNEMRMGCMITDHGLNTYKEMKQ